MLYYPILLKPITKNLIMDMTPEDREAARLAGRAELKLLLQGAVEVARQLNEKVSEMFPEAAKHVKENGPKLEGLSVDEKLGLGNQMVSDLKEMAYSVNPNAAIDLFEGELPTDTVSMREADALLGRLTSKS